MDEAAQPVKQADLEKIKGKLLEKKAKYTHKLRKGIGLQKRDETEAKLEEVQSMIKALSSRDTNEQGSD